MTERARVVEAFRGEDEVGPDEFSIRFPKQSELEQDEEWCEVFLDGSWERFRFHDYTEIYNVPGLYERLFYQTLRCCSPERVVSALGGVLRDQEVDPTGLRVLDVGAGNGMVGTELRQIGARTVVGVDILEAAREATLRDRPHVYDEYLVSDLTGLEKDEEAGLRVCQFNAMTCVAALGFGDIPPEAFCSAYNFVGVDGWLAFNIRDLFLDRKDQTGFSRLINTMLNERFIELHAYRRYVHRLTIGMEKLSYVALVAKKLRDFEDGEVEGLIARSG
ncbi:unnamed protein product [Symbiodinium necroappetens]|uniref:Methyltransferase domain-containing protein n=1 Tax=Symbiodinium necroappetens TaxID=1628268 RepID=A0A813CFW7_9DINO|nr:unnamed protein product [Symbiodinium necroappetens]